MIAHTACFVGKVTFAGALLSEIRQFLCFSAFFYLSVSLLAEDNASLLDHQNSGSNSPVSNIQEEDDSNVTYQVQTFRFKGLKAFPAKVLRSTLQAFRQVPLQFDDLSQIVTHLEEFYKKEGKIPKNLTFAMAALIYFYGKEISKHPYPLKDDPKNISFFNEIWKDNKIEKVVTETLSNTELWGQNLAEIGPLKDNLTQALNAIASHHKISEAHQVYKNLQS